MADPKDASPGFKVVDKRGRSQEPAAKEPEPPVSAEAPEPHDPALGPIDFTMFVLSLGSSAAIHLGDAPDPETGRQLKSVPHAKQIIDLLAMLREKTKGNLTKDEAKFLDGLLYDLQLRFVEASKG